MGEAEPIQDPELVSWIAGFRLRQDAQRFLGRVEHRPRGGPAVRRARAPRGGCRRSAHVRLLRGEAGDPVDSLGPADRVDVEIAGLAADADGLEHPGEVDGCDVAGGGDLADLGAAVAAVEGDVVRRLIRRGSTRPARAPASAGCPARLSTYFPPRSSSASMLPRCTGSAAAVMTVPVRSPVPSSVRCPATAASSGTTSGELVGVRGDGALGRSKASALALIIPPLRRALPPFTVPADSYVRRLAGLPGGGRDRRLAQRALRQVRLVV